MLFLPFLLGPLGGAFGVIEHFKGDRAGKWAAVADVVATIVRLVLAAAVPNATR